MLRERERECDEGYTVNVKYLARTALYLQAGKIQSSVCEYNRVLAFQSSDVCTQTLKLQKASWKHRPNSSHIDCIHAVWSLQNVILKCHEMTKKLTNHPIFVSGCSSVFLMWVNPGRSRIIHSGVKHVFNILSREPFMTIYISVNRIRMLSKLVTDVCSQGKV